MNRGAAAASEPVATAAARAALEAWGSSADAVVAGWFALAGAHEGGLLAPVVALVAGPGAGARLFDGRALQPGLGIDRPRGLHHGEDVPPGARAAVPRSVGAIALLHRQRGRLGLSKLAEAGVAAAQDVASPRRAELLGRAAAEGPAAFLRERTRDALLAAGGPLARGALSARDLADARAEDRPAAIDVIEEASVVTAARALGGEVAGPASATPLGAIVAVDAQGVAAALVVALDLTPVHVPDLEVALPGVAEPVRRGIPRTRPGEVLPMRAPLAIVERAEVRVALAAVEGGLELEDLVALAADPTLETGLSRLAARGGALSVVHDGRAGRVAVGSAR